MRLMASVAKHALGMRGGLHLGKIPGFGGVFLMTAPAQVGNVGQLGHIVHGIVCMFGQWTVAGFASYPRVLAAIVDLRLLLVTNGTLTAAGVSNRSGGNRVERVAAVVPVLAKAFGDHDGANNQEEHQSSQQDECGANQMCGISKDATQNQPPVKAILMSASARAMGGSRNKAVRLLARFEPNAQWDKLSDFG